MESPTKTQIKDLRAKLAFSTREAAKIIHKGQRAWQRWEKGDRKMDLAYWELFLIKTKGMENEGDS